MRRQLVRIAAVARLDLERQLRRAIPTVALVDCSIDISETDLVEAFVVHRLLGEQCELHVRDRRQAVPMYRNRATSSLCLGL
jgi:hypothetical protein